VTRVAPVCSNCGGMDFVWANDLKTGSLGGGSLSLRSRGELSLGTRICRACGHADLFLKDPSILRMPHTWRPGEFTPIVPRAPPAHQPAPPTPAPPPAPINLPEPVSPTPAAPSPAPPAEPAPVPAAEETPAPAPTMAQTEAPPAAEVPVKKTTRRRSTKSKSGGGSSS